MKTPSALKRLFLLKLHQKDSWKDLVLKYTKPAPIMHAHPHMHAHTFYIVTVVCKGELQKTSLKLSLHIFLGNLMDIKDISEPQSQTTLYNSNNNMQICYGIQTSSK